MNRIELVVGDWSKDGHNQSDRYVIECSHNGRELNEFFHKGTEMIGFNLKDYCQNYEDNQIPSKFLHKLIEHGFDAYETEEDEDETSSYGLMPDEYFQIYMFISVIGSNKTLNWTECKSDDVLKIGGYGCYY